MFTIVNENGKRLTRKNFNSKYDACVWLESYEATHHGLYFTRIIEV